MPNISYPFEEKDLFYYSIEFNMPVDSSDAYFSHYPSISYSFRKNKQFKSTKKLKEFTRTNSYGVDEGTFIIEEMQRKITKEKHLDFIIIMVGKGNAKKDQKK